MKEQTLAVQRMQDYIEQNLAGDAEGGRSVPLDAGYYPDEKHLSGHLSGELAAACGRNGRRQRHLHSAGHTLLSLGITSGYDDVRPGKAPYGSDWIVVQTDEKACAAICCARLLAFWVQSLLEAAIQERHDLCAHSECCA